MAAAILRGWKSVADIIAGERTARYDIQQQCGDLDPVQGGPGTNVVAFTLHAANSVSNFDQTFPLTVFLAGTDLVLPSVVTGLQLTEIGADHVGLRWNPSTDNYGIAGYWVTATIHYRARYCARGCTRSRIVSRQFFPGTSTTAVLGLCTRLAAWFKGITRLQTE
jgi:hypothetical protein